MTLIMKAVVLGAVVVPGAMTKEQARFPNRKLAWLGALRTKNQELKPKRELVSLTGKAIGIGKGKGNGFPYETKGIHTKELFRDCDGYPLRGAAKDDLYTGSEEPTCNMEKLTPVFEAICNPAIVSSYAVPACCNGANIDQCVEDLANVAQCLTYKAEAADSDASADDDDSDADSSDSDDIDEPASIDAANARFVACQAKYDHASLQLALQTAVYRMVVSSGFQVRNACPQINFSGGYRAFFYSLKKAVKCEVGACNSCFTRSYQLKIKTKKKRSDADDSESSSAAYDDSDADSDDD